MKAKTDVPLQGLNANLRSNVFYYKAFGLILKSDFEFSELEPLLECKFDIVIKRTEVNHPALEGLKRSKFDFGPDEQLMSWEEVGAFLIRGTQEIDIEPWPGIDEGLIPYPLLGPVFAMLLHLRGLLVLHASAVEIGEYGVIFLGDKGAGKSTTAGSLVSAGHRLLSDDVVAIGFGSGGEVTLFPAFGQLKLWDDAAQSLSLDAEVVADVLHTAIPKRQHQFKSAFCQTPKMPHTFYILERGERANSAPIGMIEALKEIIRFSYVVRFGPAALSQESAANHLKQCAAVVERVFVKRLTVPANLEMLSDAICIIERDVELSQKSM